MKEHRKDIIKIIITVVLFLAAVLICGLFIPDLPVLAKLIIYAVPYLVIAAEILAEALKNIFHGEVFDECFLMSVATLGAFCIGEYAEAVFVMLFFSVGELFEHIASSRSRRSISSLLELCPDTANVETESGIKEIPPKEVKIGDTILIKVGERIPLDGVISEGETSLDTSAVTGESKPKSAKQGDRVYSGCINLSAVIRVRVGSLYKDSTVSRILELVENATQRKAKTERFITKFSKIYTPAVVISAVLIATVPSLIYGDWSRHIYSALTFLVVSCPCALVVSVPLSFFAGIGAASKNGILVKGSDALENLSKLINAVFDKSGTITKGSFEVVAVHPNDINTSKLLQLAAAAEKYSTHPIAYSLISAASDIGEELKTESATELAGLGISAVIEGKKVLVGNEALMSRYGIEFKGCHKHGTVVHIAADGVYYGHIVISDKIKKNSSAAVSLLKVMNIKPFMLTGDNRDAAEAVAKEVGIDDYYFELFPQTKVLHLEKILSEGNGTTAFIGDGINDAPVLARADIGVAMGALGSDAAIESADIVIMDDNLKKLPLAVKIARKTVGIAKQNVLLSVSVKLAVLILSALSVPQIMWFAAFADAGILVVAVLNSMRAMKTKNVGL